MRGSARSSNRFGADGVPSEHHLSSEFDRMLPAQTVEVPLKRWIPAVSGDEAGWFGLGLSAAYGAASEVNTNYNIVSGNYAGMPRGRRAARVRSGGGMLGAREQREFDATKRPCTMGEPGVGDPDFVVVMLTNLRRPALRR